MINEHVFPSSSPPHLFLSPPIPPPLLPPHSPPPPSPSLSPPLSLLSFSGEYFLAELIDSQDSEHRSLVAEVCVCMYMYVVLALFLGAPVRFLGAPVG